MEHRDNIDILDLIINMLREHEKALDALAARLEELASSRQFDQKPENLKKQ
jgi:hypothetical protein